MTVWARPCAVDLRPATGGTVQRGTVPRRTVPRRTPRLSILAPAVRLQLEPATPCRPRKVVRRMKYMFLLYGPDRPFPQPGTSEFKEMLEAWDSAKEEMAKAGVLIDCAPLQPPSAATTVQVRDGQTLLTDGPAAEIKEQFGGYTLIECADLDEALKWAATIPTASDGSVEVRPVIEVVASS